MSRSLFATAKVVALLVLIVAGVLLSGLAEATGPGNSITAPDTVGEVGFGTSLALDSSGNPVISYVAKGTTDDGLRVLHCGDPSCSSGNVFTTVDFVNGAGPRASLVLDNSGNPAIAYYGRSGPPPGSSGSRSLNVLRCGDPNCTSGNVFASPDTSLNVGNYPSLVLDASNNPVVSYWDGPNEDLKVLHCGDPSCSSGNVITSPDTPGNTGDSSGPRALALDANGYPVVSYWDRTNNDLKVLHCGDVTCSSGNVITSPDTTGSVGSSSSLTLDASGYPVVSYRDGVPADLKVLHCGDANCSSGNVITTPDTAGTGGHMAGWTSIALDGSGNPVVSYGGANNDLRVLHCGDPNCSSGNVISIADPNFAGGTHTALVLDASGNPVVSHYDSNNNDLRVVHCGDPNCTGAKPTPTPTPPPPVGGISLDSDLRPLPLDTASTEQGYWPFAWVIAVATGAAAFGGGVWYTRRRWVR